MNPQLTRRATVPAPYGPAVVKRCHDPVRQPLETATTTMKRWTTTSRTIRTRRYLLSPLLKAPRLLSAVGFRMVLSGGASPTIDIPAPHNHTRPRFGANCQLTSSRANLRMLHVPATRFNCLSLAGKAPGTSPPDSQPDSDCSRQRKGDPPSNILAGAENRRQCNSGSPANCKHGTGHLMCLAW